MQKIRWNLQVLEMPATTAKPALKRKRKQELEPVKKRQRSASQSSSSNSNSDSDDDGEQSRILLLENSILESRKNYNNIIDLIEILRKHGDAAETAVVAAVSLCRVFVRLLAAGILSKKKDASEKDETIVRWLRQRLAEYKESLLPLFVFDEAALTALTLSMRILKAEAEHLHNGAEYTFPRPFFTEVVTALMQPEVDARARKELLGKFVDKYDDIRFYTLRSVR